jgi:hypothetical protein
MVLGYAKFGWEPLTRRLVRHEATVLNELGPLTHDTPLVVPRVLYAGEWRGFEALVLAPLSGAGRTPRRPSDVPVAASAALARLGLHRVERLGDTAYWRRTRLQAAQVAPVLSEHAGQIVLRACRLIEDWWGNVKLHLGQNHGDWIPPNMAIRLDGGFNVWDWERSESDIPLGMDSIQFILFFELRRRTAQHMLTGRAQEYSQKALGRHGLDPNTSRLLITLSLLGSILWFGEARDAGRTEKEDSRFVRALKECLDQNPESDTAAGLGQKPGIHEAANYGTPSPPISGPRQK